MLCSTEVWPVRGLNAKMSCSGHPSEGGAVFATQGTRLSCGLGDPGLLAHLNPLLTLQPQGPVQCYPIPWHLGCPWELFPHTHTVSSAQSPVLSYSSGVLECQCAAPTQPHRAWCLWYGSAATARVGAELQDA